MRYLNLLRILAFFSIAVGLDTFSIQKLRSRRSLNLRTMYQTALRKGQNIYNARRSGARVPVMREGNRHQADQYGNQVLDHQYTNQVQSQRMPSKTYQRPSGPGNLKWNVVRNGNSFAYSYVFNNRPTRPVVRDARITGTGGINTKYNPTFIRTGAIRPVLGPNSGVLITDPRLTIRVNSGLNGPRVVINGPTIPRRSGPNPQFIRPIIPQINVPIPVNGGPIDPRINGGNPIINGVINPQINQINPVVGGPFNPNPNGLNPTNNGPIDPRINGPINPGFINSPANRVGPSGPISRPPNSGVPINGGPLLNPGFGNPQTIQDPVALGQSQGPVVDSVPANPNDPLVFTRQSDKWIWGGDWVSGPLRGAVPANKES